MIPRHIKTAIDGYVDHGRSIGGFVFAVLCNDLFEAVARADEYSRLCLDDICKYIFNFTSPSCWGSKKKVVDWLKLHKEDPVMAEKAASVSRQARKDYE